MDGADVSEVPIVKYRDMARDADEVLNNLLATKDSLDSLWDRVLKLRIDLVTLNTDPTIYAFGDKVKTNLEECDKSLRDTKATL